MLSTAGAALAAATPSSAGVSQTVAIVAIAAGLLGTVVLFLNTSRMINAEKARQEKALEEERKRLDATLDAERARARREAIRELLNDGAVLLAGFESALLQVVEQGGRMAVPDVAAALKATGVDELINKISAFLAQLRLWFVDEDEVVEAYRAFLHHSVVRIASLQALDSEQKRLQANVEEQRKRYLDAAREHLRSGAL